MNNDEQALKIAAIDVGTNSFHMVIASVNSRGMLQVVQRDKEVVRLGSSSGDMKYLQPDAIARGLKTMQAFAEIARSENAKIYAVATSAVREAVNKDEFIEKVKATANVDIEVISGAEEGRLIYIGAMHALPIYDKKALLIDIGGGSTETVIGKQSEIIYVNSAKLGAIRLTKKFFEGGDYSQKQVKLCREYIKGDWSPTMKRLRNIGFETVVGTSGTITTLAMMTLAANNEPLPEIMNGITIDAKSMLAIINKIVKLENPKKIEYLPGTDPARSDILLAGSLIIENAIIELGIDKIFISSYALREGKVFDTVQKMKAIKEFKHLSYLRYETVLNIVTRFNVDFNHAEHVKNIAIRLFDDLAPLHKLNSVEREVLEAASLLHDIGYYISHDAHHKHSYYIIKNCIMPGFTNDEAELIANIARYHRKSHPKKKHENYQKLTQEKQNVVQVLSAILRIAEGIDRRQLRAVKEVAASINNKSINISLIPSASEFPPDIELWGANRRKLYLEETLGMPVNLSIAEV